MHQCEPQHLPSAICSYCIILQAKASTTGARKVGGTRPAMGLNQSGTSPIIGRVCLGLLYVSTDCPAAQGLPKSPAFRPTVFSTRRLQKSSALPSHSTSSKSNFDATDHRTLLVYPEFPIC